VLKNQRVVINKNNFQKIYLFYDFASNLKQKKTALEQKKQFKFNRKVRKDLRKAC